MFQKFQEVVEKNKMWNKGDTLIVGVSGGMDSMCLLTLLLKLQEDWKLSLLVVHIQHGLREKGEEDARFVESFCREQRIPCYLFQENVAEIAKHQKLSVEEAGRVVRNRRFQTVCNKEGGSRIVLAHHKDDHGETLLWNLTRGCGLNGLRGIRLIEGNVVRPLLPFTRKEIEGYVKEHQIFYREDESNFEDEYTRNRIRHHVIPKLLEENERAIEHFWETSQRINQIWTYLEVEVKKQFSCWVKGKEEGRLSLREEDYRKVPEWMREYLLLEMVYEISKEKKDIRRIHIEDLKGLWSLQSGRKLQLPRKIRAERTQEGIEVYQEKERLEQCPSVSMKVRKWERDKEARIFEENLYTKSFDYDKIKHDVRLRYRAEGDFLVITEDGRRQSLKKFFVNQKIPVRLRDKIPLVTVGSFVLWVVGYRTSMGYQVTKDTKHILEVTITEE